MKCELDKKELERLFAEVLNKIECIKNSLMFNLYEDEKAYTMEAAFDDEEIVVCRDIPALLCSVEVDFEEVLKEVGKEIKKFVNNNKDKLENAKEISYGFVDGDLSYVRKSKKAKREIKKFTVEDFDDFDSTKLLAWISVYMTEEAKEKYNPPFLARKMSKRKMKKWKKILVDNFNYESYNK